MDAAKKHELLEKQKQNIPTGIDGKKRYIYKTCHSKATQSKLPCQAVYMYICNVLPPSSERSGIILLK